MNSVELIREDPETARRKFDAYRKAAHRAALRGVEAEYAAIRDAYREQAKGLPLLRLSRAFHATGWNADGSPTLGIARADRKIVEVRLRDDHISFYSGAPGYARYDGSSSLTVQVRLADMPPRPEGAKWWRARAVVPLIPPEVLPERCDLMKRHILWEADWKEVPSDPMLLRHLGGDLWVVEAAWDLTEVERAVLAGRIREGGR